MVSLGSIPGVPRRYLFGDNSALNMFNRRPTTASQGQFKLTGIIPVMTVISITGITYTGRKIGQAYRPAVILFDPLFSV